MDLKFDVDLKGFIMKIPLILVCFLLICLGVIFYLIGRFITTRTIQELLTEIVILVFLIIFLVSIIEACSAYKRNERPRDLFFIPLIYSVFFSCMALILLLFFGILREVYINSVEPELNHIVFPLAIFALGSSLYYFFIVQFSTDRKLDLILRELKEIKDTSISNTVSNKEVIDTSSTIPKKDYMTISDEDKIILKHLFDRHKKILSYIDIMDTKVASVIAFNGLILSFIILNASKANLIVLCFLGILIIIFSIFMGVRCYSSRDLFIGASVKFFKDYDVFPDGIGLKKLKQQLLLDIKRNEKTQNFKARLFDIEIYTMFVGLILILAGYYG